MWLSTRENRGLNEEEDMWNEIWQHQQIYTIFLRHILTKVKFSFSEKAIKIYAILLMVLTFTQNHKDDGANFCGLLRKAEFY